MTKTTDTPKRWRPRFSLRTLVLFVTLVCVYFGAWEATKKYGVPAVFEFVRFNDLLYVDVDAAQSSMPFCVHVRYRSMTVGGNPYTILSDYDNRRFYLWMFGWIVHVKDESQNFDPAGV